MSTLLYAERTQQRQVAAANTSTSESSPKSPTPLDILVALVPAEVLAAHAVAINAFTKTDNGGDGGAEGAVTTITDPSALRFTFWGLIAFALFLYVVRKKEWRRSDYVRMLIPPAAFVGWTMAQQNTAFDAVFSIGEGSRGVVVVIVAGALAALSQRLATKADQEDGGGNGGNGGNGGDGNAGDAAVPAGAAPPPV